ncbi:MULTISPECIES: 30S ribosomal protein S6 [Kytococcus]|uniref:Small ribosomal subunit protein bS6 n=1 Tax=Kytococcus schroeteri TaxID=138300 RepID=A0A2I1PCZ1_9MICO|nr:MULTISPECIES: 30S ribosomal protein S6 [Kytococcus]OFS15903.1 30S ribosomal protein S6 [Kytococcus sp. HMSC28H12]PKZ42470.1 30S ribosomal protein S6 [Kytococcus schroeteri]
MRQYELMMIIDPETDERTLPAMVEKLLTVVKAEGGSVDETDIWGRRRLAYDIKKKSEGLYVVTTLTMGTDTAKELDRQLGLNESVLRFKLQRPTV